MKTQGTRCNHALLLVLSIFAFGTFTRTSQAQQKSPPLAAGTVGTDGVRSAGAGAITPAATTITHVEASHTGQQTSIVASPPGLQGEPEKFQNAVENGMLTFHAKDQPLRSILEEIGEKGRVTMVVAEDLGNEEISVDFRRYSLDEALRQMLKGYDALFLYGADDGSKPASLKNVWVYPPKQAPDIDGISLGAWRADTKRIERTLIDPSPEVRAHAVDTLIRRERGQAAGIVLDALRDPSRIVRNQALSRALSMGVDLPQDVLADLALNDESPDVRLLALQALPLDPALKWVFERASQDASHPIMNMARDLLEEFDISNAAPGPTAN